MLQLLLLETSWFYQSEVVGFFSLSGPCPVFQQAAPLGEGGLGVERGRGGWSGCRGPAEPGELPEGQRGRAEEESASPTNEGGAGKQVSAWLGRKLGAKQSSKLAYLS